MSHRSGRGDVRDRRDPHPRGGPHPTRPAPGPALVRVKRRKTKRERDTAKFGRKVPGRFRWEAGPPPHRLLPPWGGRPAASPLPVPKTVVITQNRLCQHRGMFNREVKSVDVERLLSPRPGQDSAPRNETPGPAPEGDPHPEPGRPEPPQSEGEEGFPAELAGRLGALLGGTQAFSGRDLVAERRGTILAALLHRHRTLPDLSLLLPHHHRGTDAAPPGHWSPRTPEQGLRGSAERGDLGEQEQSWDPTPPYSSTPGPLQAIVNRTPTPSPIFGGDEKKRETPFSWTSGEEEDDTPLDSPAPLFQPRGERTLSWGDPRRHGGALPGSSPACACGGPTAARSHAVPQPTPAAFREDTGEGCSWSRRPPIAPPAFSPVAPRCHRPPRRSFPVLFAPRCPDLRRGASPDPPTPDLWTPEASCQTGFAPGWPCAERRVPCCRRHHPLHHDPLHHNPQRHDPHCCGSHRLSRLPRPPSPGTCCRQTALEHGPPQESRRRWDWEDWWDAPEPVCRRGRGEAGWLRALRRLPLSCFPAPAALEGVGIPLPSPGSRGCPCAGLY